MKYQSIAEDNQESDLREVATPRELREEVQEMNGGDAGFGGEEADLYVRGRTGGQEYAEAQRRAYLRWIADCAEALLRYSQTEDKTGSRYRGERHSNY